MADDNLIYKPELTQPGVSPGYIKPAATYATNQHTNNGTVGQLQSAF